MTPSNKNDEVFKVTLSKRSPKEDSYCNRSRAFMVEEPEYGQNCCDRFTEICCFRNKDKYSHLQDHRPEWLFHDDGEDTASSASWHELQSKIHTATIVTAYKVKCFHNSIIAYCILLLACSGALIALSKTGQMATWCLPPIVCDGYISPYVILPICVPFFFFSWYRSYVRQNELQDVVGKLASDFQGQTGYDIELVAKWNCLLGRALYLKFTKRNEPSTGEQDNKRRVSGECHQRDDMVQDPELGTMDDTMEDQQQRVIVVDIATTTASKRESSAGHRATLLGRIMGNGRQYQQIPSMLLHSLQETRIATFLMLTITVTTSYLYDRYGRRSQRSRSRGNEQQQQKATPTAQRHN